MKIHPHSIVMLVGPTNCGKDYFLNNTLLPFLNSTSLKSKVLSTDQIRRELLCDPTLNKYDPRMKAISKPTFDTLIERLNVLTSYPVNHEIVIINSTGLSEDFRNQIKTIAKTNHYKTHCIVFDYRDRKDYSLNVDQIPSEFRTSSVKSIHKHIDILRTKTLKEVNRRNYNNIDYVRNLDHSQIELSIDNLELYEKTKISNDTSLLVASDIHECLSSFKTMISKDKYNSTICLNGDWIDKGYLTVIDYFIN